MVIEQKQTDGGWEVVVFGETLTCDVEGTYLLPGRLVIGLRTDDLPVGIRFGLLDQLPSGVRFFPEDTVIFQRVADGNELEVEVTTIYDARQWDGMFSLQATMESRRRVISSSMDYALHSCEQMFESYILSFGFTLPAVNDLESVLEQVCDKTRWVEEKGNEGLLFGRWTI
jgi:hypothetical protein